MASDVQDALDGALIAAIPSEYRDDAPMAEVLDARGLACPMPLLKAKLALRTVPAGSALYLLASDKNSQTDIAAFCAKQGIDCTSWVSDDGQSVYHFILSHG